MLEDSKDGHSFFENLVKSLHEAVIKVNLKAEILYASPQFYELFGYKPEELIDSKIIDYVHPDDIKKILRKFKEAIKSRGNLLKLEFRAHHKDGNYLNIDSRGKLIEEEGKKRIVGVLRDVTQEKKAQKKSQFLSSLIQHIKDAIIVTDIDFNIIFVNQATESLFGYSKEELIGKSPGVLNAEPLAEEIQQKIYKTVASGQSYLGYFKNRKKNGTTFICEMKISPLISESGELNGYIGIQRDVTERKKTEKKLRQSEEKYRLLIESLSDMIFVIDEENRYEDVYTSQSKEEDLYEDPSVFLGKNVEDILPPKISNSFIECANKVRKSGTQQAFEYKLKIDGKEKWFSATIDQHKNSNKIISVVRNITKRKRAENEMKEALKKADLYKDLFIHDMTNILQNLSIPNELILYQLDKSKEDDSDYKYSKIIEQQIKRGKMLIRNVRTLSLIEDTDTNLKKVKADSLLKNAIETVEHMILEPAEITINNPIGPIYVKADDLLENVFENILINGIRHNNSDKKK